MATKTTWFWILLTALYGFTAVADAPPPGPEALKVSLIAQDTAVQPDRETSIAIRFQIPKDWHLYWTNPGDSGIPPKVEWKLPPGFSTTDLRWPAPEKLMAGPLVNFGYADELVLMTTLRPPREIKESTVPLRAKLSWLICKDICVPGKTEVSLRLPVGIPHPGADAPVFASARRRLPEPLPNTAEVRAEAKEGGKYVLTATGLSGDKAFFFPFDKRVFDNVSEQAHREGGNWQIDLTKSEIAEGPPTSADGLLVVGDHAYELRAPIQAVAGFRLLLQELALAFLGGLILNLMPCVFPVLSIKAFSLLEQAHKDRAAVRRHGILYTLGVLVSFWLLAIGLIALRAGGKSLGWGFQLQSPMFVAALTCLLFALGLNLLGIFELGGSLSGVGNELASKPGNAGAFFTGVLATVVATPCTAPFMGTALGFAAGQPAATAILVFTSLALGLAIPYLLLSFTPALGRLVPRPGRWMESVKQFMAFPLFGTVIWLMWVVGLQTDLTVVAKLLTGLLLMALAAWTVGRWHNRLSSGVAMLIVAVGLWIGVWGARSNTAQAGEAIHWEPYSHSRLSQLLAEGKPVFVDFTAAWCVTCKVNETVALSSPTFAAKIKEWNIVTLRGDWTNSDAEITQALAEQGRNGVPLYVVYSSRKGEAPRVLPQILTESLVLDELAKAR